MKKYLFRYGLYFLGMMVMLVWVSALFAADEGKDEKKKKCIITISQPALEQRIQAGSVMNIVWSCLNASGRLSIDIRKGNTLVHSGEGHCTGNGSLSWPIPATQQPGRDYQVNVTLNSESGCSASRTFVIYAPPPPPPPSKPGTGGVIQQKQTNPNTYKLK